MTSPLLAFRGFRLAALALAVAALTAASLSLPGTASAAPPTSVESESLVPAWGSWRLDYTTLCEEPVSFQIKTKPKLSFAGKKPRSGTWKETVSLSPGQAVQVKVAGRVHSIRCRPSDLVLPSVDRFGPVQGRFYLVSPNISLAPGAVQTDYLMILNENGVPVWWRKDVSDLTPVDFKALDRRTLAWTRGSGAFTLDPGNRYEIRNLDGTLKSTVKPVPHGADFHDLEPTPDGNWLVIAYVPRNCPTVPSDCEDLSPWGGPAEANILDGVIQKVSPDGELLWSWNSKDHIEVEESADWIPILLNLAPDAPSFDLVHLNSLEAVPGGVVFSARHVDATYRIRYSDGGIDWKLGGTGIPESLDVEGDPLGPDTMSGNHDARVLPNGNVTLHDNGSRFNRPPRMLRFEIDGNKAILRGQLVDPMVADSFCCGGGRKLEAGNWVINWGASVYAGEYRPSGAQVLRFGWPGGLFSYRMDPAPFMRLEDLRKGMDKQFPR